MPESQGFEGPSPGHTGEREPWHFAVGRDVLSRRGASGLVAAPRHLTRAPITEAIFDFRVKADPTLTVERLRSAHSAIGSGYPRVEPRRTMQYEVRFGPNAAPSVPRDLGPQGYFFHSEDEKQVAQFRVDGYTFNRLSPYTSWDALLPEVMRLWRVYYEVATPEAEVRLAVRYLNRIPLPSTMRDMEQYLAAPPSIPAELPQQLSGFLTRVTIHDVDTGLTANIGQTLEADTVEQSIHVIMDIDVYDQEVRKCDSPDIPSAMERMRDLKNRVFFGLLTEEAVRALE